MYRKWNQAILTIACLLFFGTFMYQLATKVMPSIQSSPSRSLSNQKKTIQAPSSSSSVQMPKASVGHSSQSQTGLVSYLGQPDSRVLKDFGQPVRKDPSPYGYDWWIYGEGTEKYMQIGVEAGKVVTIYALGNELHTSSYSIGTTMDQLKSKYDFSSTPTFTYNGTWVQFQLQDSELKTRPLVKVGQNWAQLYIDQFTGRLSSIRYMTPSLVIEQRPFSMEYRGKVPAAPTLSSQQWNQVDLAEEKEIASITNVLRVRYKVKPLNWSDQAEKAAFLHSKEMDVKNYFSHDSKWQGDLTTRLEKQHITFQLAGENIAAHYEDGISATAGWLDSAEHRKNLLHPKFTEIGVGVYHDYFTQDFVRPLIP